MLVNFFWRSTDR